MTRNTGTVSNIENISTAEANDTLIGNSANNIFNSFAGNDTLYGGAGDDSLYSGDGDDELYGGDGSDLLYGGSGADKFIFLDAETGSDTVADFDVEQGDILDLSNLLSGYDSLSHAISDFVSITESGGSSTLYVDQDGIGTAYSLTAVATLSGITGITDEAALISSGNLVIA